MKLLSEGQIVGNVYEVERFLGEGTLAEVYRVKHRFLGRLAMKVLKAPGMTQEDTYAMLQEAAVLSRISHPNIVRVYDAGITNTQLGERPFFTMEYVAGGSLTQFWKSHGSRFIPTITSVEILRQVCRGLSVAHREKPPIIHRDINLQNILIGYDTSGLHARLADFGFVAHFAQSTNQTLTEGSGINSFNAPEIVGDSPAYSCASDVWALGCILYVLVTDRMPFQASETDAGLNERTVASLLRASTINDSIDSHLEAIIQRALSFSATSRYPSAIEMLDALETWAPQSADGGGVNPPEPSISEANYVFISYKREDLARIVPFMHRIVSWGFPIWYDRGIPGGAEWDALIEERIIKCKALVVFLSEAAVESKWVRREIKLADSENRPILGIRLDKDVELKHGLKVVLNQYQMIDASSADFSDALRKAIEYVRLL